MKYLTVIMFACMMIFTANVDAADTVKIPAKGLIADSHEMDNGNGEYNGNGCGCSERKSCKCKVKCCERKSCKPKCERKSCCFSLCDWSFCDLFRCNRCCDDNGNGEDDHMENGNGGY